MKAHEVVQAALDAAANQILSVVAPSTSRLARAVVRIEDASTAMTNGIFIVLPPAFEGVDVASDAAVAVGLLAHEISHFLQPLEAMAEAGEETGAPGWLGNILLDIQGEAMIEGIFPSLGHPLQAVRQVVARAHMASYVDGVRRGRGFADAAGHAALAGRFYHPPEPFSPNWADEVEDVAVDDRMARYLYRLHEARFQKAGALPDLLREIMREFPELREAHVPHMPLSSPTVVAGGSFGSAAREEARRSVADFEPAFPEPLCQVPFHPAPPDSVAVAIARSIRTRFHVRRGSLSIAAPGRVERRAAARGAGIPCRMDLPGNEAPMPRVVICLDVSDSMWDVPVKVASARIAAQALALAIREGGGEAVGILFHQVGLTSRAWDASPLFAPRREWPHGGTSFGFLTDAWCRFPDHQFILVTDGDGHMPFVSEPDRERTVGLLIPPDGSAELLQRVCHRVVELRDVRDLPWVMAMLVPRVTMG